MHPSMGCIFVFIGDLVPLPALVAPASNGHGWRTGVFNKIHVSPDAILARRRLLKLLLMETATFTTNTEGYFGYFASGAVGKKVYNIPNLDFISKERRTVCSRSRN